MAAVGQPGRAAGGGRIGGPGGGGQGPSPRPVRCWSSGVAQTASGADGPHIVDTQQPRRGQDRGVRQAMELRLRWACDHQRIDTRGLGGHDVHHHAGGVDRVAARHVEADARDRHPTLGHRGTRGECRRGVGTTLVGVHCAGAFDGYLESGADI